MALTVPWVYLLFCIPALHDLTTLHYSIIICLDPLAELQSYNLIAYQISSTYINRYLLIYSHFHLTPKHLSSCLFTNNINSVN